MFQRALADEDMTSEEVERFAQAEYQRQVTVEKLNIEGDINAALPEPGPVRDGRPGVSKQLSTKPKQVQVEAGRLGTLESWDNNDFICSLALAANGNTQELDRRLWRPDRLQHTGHNHAVRSLTKFAITPISVVTFSCSALNPLFRFNPTSSIYSARLISICRLCRPPAGSDQAPTSSPPL